MRFNSRLARAISLVFVGMLCASHVASAQNKLVAAWSFDSVAGQTYYDVTGHGYDAVSAGTGIGLTPGIKGNALSCSGSSFEVVASNSRNSFNLSKFSIECWYRATAAPTAIAKIFDFQYILSGIRNGYGVHITSDGHIDFGMSSSDGTAWEECMSNTSLAGAQWYHIVCSYDSSAMKVYLNGVLERSIAYAGTYVPPLNDARIGCQRRTDGSVLYQANGMIDELKLYNYALSPDTVLSHYNALKPPPVQNSLIASWTFDVDTGKTFHDVTGHGFDAVGSGDTLGVIAGLSGKALACSGNNFKLQVQKSNGNLNFSNFTIEAWVNSKVNLVNPGSDYNYREVFNYKSVNGGVAGGYGLYVTADGKLECALANTSSSWVWATGPQVLQPNTWYHIVGVYDGAELKVYLNGICTNKISYTGSYVPAQYDAVLGCEMLTDGSVRNRWNGRIDEVKLYNYALNQDTVLAHYNALTMTNAPNSLVASWTFDSVSGKTFYDVTGHGYDALLTGDSVRISDGLAMGKALECRGAAADSVFNTFDIKVKNSIGDFNLPKFTIEGWIYSFVDLVNPGSFYNVRAIFENTIVGMEGSGLAGGYSIGVNMDGKLYFSMGNSAGWATAVTDSIILPNRWHHVVATYDGLVMRLYLNGTLASQTTNALGYVASLSPAIIGAEYQMTSGNIVRTRRFFNGKIDELKLYNYALDASTIQQHYDALKPANDRPFKINFGMRITYCNPGDTVWVPIYLTNYEDYVISACQFSLKIDTAKIKLLSISNDSGLVNGWNLNWNTKATDSIMVGLAGVTNTIKYGEGELARCKYLVKSSVRQGDTCSIQLGNIQIDENYKLVSAQSVPGKIIVTRPAIVYGDVTGDGTVTVFDGRDILSYVVGQIQLPDPSRPNFTVAVADVSGNGSITSYDAALVFQYSVGMLPEFPVMRGGALRKSAFTAGPPVATLAITLASQSPTEGMKFNITGSNLNGFVAGEFFVGYDPNLADVSKGTVITPLRGADLVSRLEPTNHLLKIALTDNDDVCTSDPVVLATITLPPNSTLNPSTAFSLTRALVNEGKIPTNLPTGTPAQAAVVHNSAGFRNVVYRDQKLRIYADAKAVRVQLFTLNGRRIENAFFENASAAPIQVNMRKYRGGSYVYRVAIGDAEVRTGRIVVER